MNRALKHSSFAQLLIASALAGCAGTSTGNPDDGDVKQPDAGGDTATGNEGAYASCMNSPKDLATLDTKTSLGFSANDVLAFAGGEHEISMRWGGGNGLDVTPAAGVGKLHITVTPKGDKARFVDSMPKENAGGTETAIGNFDELGGNPCPDRVEIDVHVTLQSDDGGLDESFDTTLSAADTRVVSVYEVIKADDIEGSLSIKGKDSLANFKLDAIGVSTRFSALGIAGSISPQLSSIDKGGDTSSGSGGGGTGTGGVATSGGSVASWPADDACDSNLGFDGFTVGVDDTFGDSSLMKAIALANAADDVNVTWGNGDVSKLDLQLAVSKTQGCAHFGTYEDDKSALLDVAGTLKAKSADGRIDASWPVQLTATFANADGEYALSKAQLRSSAQGTIVEGLVAADKFEDTYGISGVDLGDYDQANALIDLSIATEGALASQLDGTVTIQGAVIPECLMPQPEPKPDPMQGQGGGSSSGGSAGCAGIDLQEIETLDISNK